jgi:hypothetical protein
MKKIGYHGNEETVRRKNGQNYETEKGMARKKINREIDEGKVG